MKIDLSKLSTFRDFISRYSNDILMRIDYFDDDIKKIINTDNWNSDTQKYFLNRYNAVKKNRDTVADLLKNVNDYLANLSTNYTMLDVYLGNSADYFMEHAGSIDVAVQKYNTM